MSDICDYCNNKEATTYCSECMMELCQDCTYEYAIDDCTYDVCIDCLCELEQRSNENE